MNPHVSLSTTTLNVAQYGYLATKKGYYLLPSTPSLMNRLGFNLPSYLEARSNMLERKESSEVHDSRLRIYQNQDISYLMQLPHLGIFNQQRTGKTPTLCCLLKAKGFNQSVIVAPASTIYKWKEEYLFWNGGACEVVSGSKPKRLKLYKEFEGTLVIGYETLRMDIEEVLKLRPQVDGLVLDEAHRLRNYKSQQSKAIFKLGKKAQCRIAMSGTPAYNKADNLFGILHFLYPTLFSSYWNFVNYYFNVEEKVIYPGGMPKKLQEVGQVRADRQTELSEFLELISTQRKRQDIMKWLPQKDYQMIKLPLEKKQEKAYNEIVNFWETKGGEVVCQNQLDRLTRLRQMCVAPELLGVKGKSPKTDWILQFIKDYPDTPVLIVSKFESYLRLLAEHLPNALTISGRVSKKTRYENIQSFQSGQTNVMLLQVDASKEGLTLDRAEAMIFVDRYPPVGDIEQVEDRFVTTQEGAYDKPHTVYLLEMEGTIDEYLSEMLQLRLSETEIINNYEVFLNVPSPESKTRKD